MTIKFNSAERLIAQQATYYRYWQPLKHNKRLPKKTIYAYNFALNLMNINQGTCNFSRIPQAIFNFNSIGETLDTKDIFIFAINYNILKIESGHAGLVYAN